MKMSIDRYWVYLFVALIAFVTGFAAANTFISFEPKSGDAATWFGAVGAFLAFGATIWVATDQTRQKNLEAHNRALLTVARLLPRLEKFKHALASFCGDIEEQVTLKVDYSIAQKNLQALCDWSTDEVLPLMTLPNDVAYRLVVVASLLPVLADKANKSMERTTNCADCVEGDEAKKLGTHDAIKEYSCGLKSLYDSTDIVCRQLTGILPRVYNNLTSD